MLLVLAVQLQAPIAAAALGRRGCHHVLQAAAQVVVLGVRAGVVLLAVLAVLLEGRVLHGCAGTVLLCLCDALYEDEAVGHLGPLLVLSLQVCDAEHAVRGHLLDLAQRCQKGVHVVVALGQQARGPVLNITRLQDLRRGHSEGVSTACQFSFSGAMCLFAAIPELPRLHGLCWTADAGLSVQESRRRTETETQGRTCLTASGHTVLTTLHSSTPPFNAVRKPWSVAYGGDTPVQSLMNWEAALRLAARLGSAWLGRACLVELLLLDVLDGSAGQPSCRERTQQQ